MKERKLLWAAPFLAAAVVTGRAIIDKHPSFGTFNYDPSGPIGGVYPRSADTSFLEDYRRQVSNFGWNQRILSDPILTQLDTYKVREMAREQLMYGIAIAKEVLPPTEAPLIISAPDKNLVRFMDRDFDLLHPLQQHLLYALTNLRLDNKATGDQLNLVGVRLGTDPYLSGYLENLEKSHKASEKGIEDILWLHDQNLPISVQQDAYGLFSTRQTINLARTLHIMRENNLPFPQRIDYVRWEKGLPAGGYFDHNQSSSFRFTVMVANVSGDLTITHELGHFISDAMYLDPINPKLVEFSQLSYETLVRPLEDNPNIKDKSNTAASTPQENLAEDYAVTFQTYLLEGGKFRSNLKRVEKTDLAAYIALHAKYNFMRRLLGGIEYFKDGTAPSKKYELNSLVTVKDEDIFTPGIYLHQDGVEEFTPEFPAVFNGDIIQIIGGSQIKRDRFGQERNYWRIRVASAGNLNLSLTEGASLAQEGWLPDDYFGPLVATEGFGGLTGYYISPSAIK